MDFFFFKSGSFEDQDLISLAYCWAKGVLKTLKASMEI